MRLFPRIVAAILVLGLALITWSAVLRRNAEVQLAAAIDSAANAGHHARHVRISSRQTTEWVIERGMTFAGALTKLDLDPQTVFALVESARPVFDFRQLRPGNRVQLVRSGSGELRLLNYQIDPERQLWIERHGEELDAVIRQTPVHVRLETVAGRIDGSLFESVTDAGEGPELALRLAEIFAWDLDFYTDPQPGDTFAVVVEKKEFASGAPPAYGRILAAQYNNVGKAHRAVLFRDSAGSPSYYSAEGKPLRKAFLRSPLKFARISSRFSRRRYHPVLKIYRPHLGTDYAAPTGTPVQAIGNGRVVFAGRRGGSGNMVTLAHTNGYESHYLHLSGILVRTGARVAQGDIIGRVGSTGLATGPHLDFRLRRNGNFINFERLLLPSADPVARADLADFKAERDRYMPLLAAALSLPGVETAQATAAVD